jgi:hypothetical protein
MPTVKKGGHLLDLKMKRVAPKKRMSKACKAVPNCIGNKSSSTD